MRMAPGADSPLEICASKSDGHRRIVGVGAHDRDLALLFELTHLLHETQPHGFSDAFSYGATVR